MPSKKICRCGKLIDTEQYMCEECKVHKDKKVREYDKQRGSSSERGYDSKWRKYREAYLRKNPLCVHCKEEGKYTPATVIDHITPHKGDKKLFWNPKNHQSLCKKHHDIKTVKEDGGFGNCVKRIR